MAKRWNEVEQSEAFQSLSPQAKVNAKRQYWNDVVSNKDNYIALSNESKQKAKSQFFGGTLTEDMPDSEVNVPLETAVGTAKTIGRSTGKLVEPFLHPIQTAKGLGYAAIHPIQTGKAIGEDYKQAYGGVENIAETVAEDPVRFLTDVSMVGGIASGGLKAAGRASQSSKGAKIIEAGSLPTLTQGKGLSTFQKGLEKTGKAVKSFQKSPQQLADEATRIYREILNPGKREIRAVEIKGKQDINKYYRLAAEEGLPIKQTIDKGNSPKLYTVEAIDSLKPKIAIIHDELNSVLGQQTKTFDLMDVADKAKRSIRSNKMLAAHEVKKQLGYIDDYIAAEVERHGQIVDAVTFNNVKQGAWGIGYNKLEPTAYKGARAIGSTIRKSIEDSFPAENIRALNMKSGDYQGLISLLEEANGRIVQGGKIGKYFAQGTGALAGGLAGSAIPIPGVGAVAGAIAGREIGGRIAGALNNPALRSAKAAEKMQEALRRMPKPALKPDIIIDRRIVERLRLPAPMRKLLERKTGVLPHPKDIPYKPTGFRNDVKAGSVKMGNQTSGEIINAMPYPGQSIPRGTLHRFGKFNK